MASAHSNPVLIKSADPNASVAPQDYSLTAAGLEQQQRDRLAMVMKLIPISALVGGGLGGLASLSRINQTNQPAVDAESDPVLLGENVQKKKKPAGLLGVKLAEDNLFNNVAKTIMPAEQHAQPHTGVWGPSLVAASTLIPGYLAYKAMRGVGQEVAEDSEDADVTAAEQEFQQARAKQYRYMMLNKKADHVFEQAMSKQATIAGAVELPYVSTYGAAASHLTGLPPHEAWRLMLGLGVATAGIGGVAAAAKGYNSATRKTPEQVAQMILDKRQQQLAKKPYSPTPELLAMSAD